MLLFVIIILLNLQNWQLSGRLPWLFRICLPIFSHLWRCFYISGLCSNKNCLPMRILLIYGNQKVICVTTLYHMWRENGCSQVKIFFWFLYEILAIDLTMGNLRVFICCHWMQPHDDCFLVYYCNNIGNSWLWWTGPLVRRGQKSLN